MSASKRQSAQDLLEQYGTNVRQLRAPVVAAAPPVRAPEPPTPHGFRRYKVSPVGQITLPAAVRQRWGVVRSGAVEIGDFGEAVLVLPLGGSKALWMAFLDALGMGGESVDDPASADRASDESDANSRSA